MNVMAQHGAALQTYNQELVKCIEELKTRRGKMQLMIDKELNEKHSLEKEIESLTFRLNEINENLKQKNNVRKEYDRIISETENAYVKIVESSQVLLNMVRQEAKVVVGTVDQTCVHSPKN